MSNNNINKKLSDYVNGNMSGEQEADFLHLAENNPFLLDAIEGFKQTNASPNDLIGIKKKIIKSNKKSFLNIVVAVSVAASLILFAFYIAKDTSWDLQHNPKRDLQVQSSNIPLVAPQDSIEKEDSVLVIDNCIDSYTSEMRIVPHEFVVPESIAPLYTIRSITVENDMPDNELDYSYMYRSNHYYSYVGDFKIVDYRYDKRKNRNNLNIIEHGTSFTMNRNVLVPKTQMTYMDFLQAALDKYKSNAYVDAVSDFNIILEQFPKDANAIFYKALCFYELGENDKALYMFDKAISLSINTFHEEAMWYSGMIYKNKKQYAAAEQVLQEIVDDKGYYGVQAQKELDELYKTYINE